MSKTLVQSAFSSYLCCSSVSWSTSRDWVLLGAVDLNRGSWTWRSDAVPVSECPVLLLRPRWQWLFNRSLSWVLNSIHVACGVRWRWTWRFTGSVESYGNLTRQSCADWVSVLLSVSVAVCPCQNVVGRVHYIVRRPVVPSRYREHSTVPWELLILPKHCNILCLAAE